MVDPATLARLGVAALSNEKTRKGLGWVLVAILSPVIVVVVLILALLSGASQSNSAIIDLSFNSAPIPPTVQAELSGQIAKMRNCLTVLDGAIAEVNAMTEDGSVDGARVKAVFFCLRFGDNPLSLTSDEARAFVDSFVRYETRTRTAESTDPDTGETVTAEEEYTVAVVVGLDAAYGSLAGAGCPITEKLKQNAGEVYGRVTRSGFAVGP